VAAVAGTPAKPGPGSVGETLYSARNLRVAVVGNVDAGKSTLIGTLAISYLDDGRGRSESNFNLETPSRN
jgi:GTPase